MSGGEPVIKETLRFLGLDVHYETIAIAVAEPDGEVRSLGMIPNRAESIRKMIKKLGPSEKLRACYEAGPTGYVVNWLLTELAQSGSISPIAAEGGAIGVQGGLTADEFASGVGLAKFVVDTLTFAIGYFGACPQ